MDIYAIGDIHGQLDLLHAAHARIEADGGKDALVVHVGDLVDRGPDSAGVVDYLAKGHAAGRNWITLKGNHDRMLQKFVEDPDWVDHCLNTPTHWTELPGLGAAATIASYDVDPDQPADELARAMQTAVPEAHLRFLQGLPLWHMHENLLFVHAGIRPGIGLLDQSEDDLVWIRKGFLEDTRDHGALVIHGHTALKQTTHFGNRLDIDSSAAYGGPLSAIVMSDGTPYLLEENGRQKIERSKP